VDSRCHVPAGGGQVDTRIGRNQPAFAARGVSEDAGV